MESIVKTSTGAPPPRTLALVDEPASVTAALAMLGGGQTRRISEQKLETKSRVALSQDGQDQPPHLDPSPAPASRLERRAGGAADPRLVTDAMGSKHTPTMRAAEGALLEAASLLRGLLGAPSGSGAEQLPKVITAVTEALNGLRAVATLFESGRAERGPAVDFQPAFAAFLEGYAALRTSDGGSNPGLTLLAKRLAEVWGLAPAILGAEIAASLKAEGTHDEAHDRASTQDAAEKLSRFLERDPAYTSPEVSGTLSFLKDVHLRVGWFRDAGQHRLYCSASPKTSKGRSVSLEDVASAVRAAQLYLGLAPIPFLTSGPKLTESRIEEAWGLVRQAFAAQDPESLQRWQPGSLHLHAPVTGLFADVGGYLDPHRGLQVDLYSNDGWLTRADEPSFKKGTQDGLERELRRLLAGHGLGDIRVDVTKARRTLTPDHAQAIRDRLEGLRSSESKPAAASPEAQFKAQVSEIKVERDPYSNELEVAVYVPASGTGYYGEPLLLVEEAVRALLADDPSTIGTRIRVKLDPQPDARGYRPEMISVLFGNWTSPERQAHAKAEGEAIDARHAPYIASYRLERRAKALERFAAGGPIQGELVTQMRHDPNEAKGEGKAALTHNLAAWFLGEGAADPTWTRRFEQLPLAQRPDFLELALAFLEDGAAPPALVEASRTFRRLNGRVELERACTQNGTQSAAQMAETDAIFTLGLGGPAKDAALAAIAQARAR